MDLDAVAARNVADAVLQHPAAGLVFAGAWLGNGFHEDGFESGLRAALALALGAAPRPPTGLPGALRHRREEFRAGPRQLGRAP